MSEYGSHEISGAAHGANGPEAVFWSGRNELRAKRMYRYKSGQFFSLIDKKQIIDHETESDQSIGSGEVWLVGRQLGLSNI